jgi:hypothetical protein
MSTDVPPEHVSALCAELKSSLPAAALRAVALRFRLNRSALSFVAAEACENILTPEVQAIWQWDLDHTGKGHTDEELNSLLSHLVTRE